MDIRCGGCDGSGGCQNFDENDRPEIVVCVECNGSGHEELEVSEVSESDHDSDEVTDSPF